METIIPWPLIMLIFIALPILFYVFAVWFVTRIITKEKVDKGAHKGARYLGKLFAEFNKGKKDAEK